MIGSWAYCLCASRSRGWVITPWATWKTGDKVLRLLPKIVFSCLEDELTVVGEGSDVPNCDRH